MDLKLVVLSVLFLLFCSEVSSHRLQKRETLRVFTQFQKVAGGYWNQTSEAIQAAMEKMEGAVMTVTEKASNIYEKSTETLSTYGGIALDQFISWWNDE